MLKLFLCNDAIMKCVSGMVIVEQWNGGMVEWIFFLFACLSTNYYSMT